MRRWVALAIMLVAVALVILGMYRSRSDLGQALVARRERAETLAAWPVLREWASLRGARAAGGAATPGAGGAGGETAEGVRPAGVPGLPDGVPAFAAWRALPPPSA